MGRVIAIVNEKGGVGKTITTVNLGVALAKKGKKVCVIDCDPQMSLGIALGFRDMPDNLYSLMYCMSQKKEYNIEDCILHHSEKIDLIPSSRDLATFDMNAGALSYHLLKKSISPVHEKYDYILIDCRPSLGTLTLNALVAADAALIPVLPQHLSVEGVVQVVKTISEVQEDLNKDLKIDGILFTMVEKHKRFSKQVMSSLEQSTGKEIRIYKTVIPRLVRAEEVSSTGYSLFEYDPRGKATNAYAQLAKEISG